MFKLCNNSCCGIPISKHIIMRDLSLLRIFTEGASSSGCSVIDNKKKKKNDFHRSDRELKELNANKYSL